MDRKLASKRIVRTLRDGEEKKHLEMLNLCYNPWGNEERWRKFYLQEGFDATQNVLVVEENDEWAGGVTAWFREVFLAQAKTVKACIAGDGYVLPSQRGKGLYSFYMKSVNEMAKNRNAALDFGFISAYNLPPLKALPKIGFFDALFPITKILVFNPERFFDYMVAEWAREFNIPAAFDNMSFVITISFTSYKGKVMLCKKFSIENGKLIEVSTFSPFENRRNKTDLWIKTDIETLSNVVKQLSVGKRKLLVALLVAIFKRRLSLRFSMRLLEAFLRL